MEGKARQGEQSQAELLCSTRSSQGVLTLLSRRKGKKKSKTARLEVLSLASSLENDVMLLIEKMFAAFY